MSTNVGSLNDDVAQVIKVMLVGKAATGKSSLLASYLNEDFKEEYVPTIGVDFEMRTCETSKGKKVKFQFWDTSGEEKFRCVTYSYYRGAHAVILVYDVTNAETFQALPDCMKIISQYGLRDSTVILVGNKADSNDSNRQVSKEMGRQFAEENDLKFYEASARDHINVKNIFQELAEIETDSPPKLMATAPGPFTSMSLGRKKSRTCLIL